MASYTCAIQQADRRKAADGARPAVQHLCRSAMLGPAVGCCPRQEGCAKRPARKSALGGGFECDVVAEGLEFGDETAGFAFRVEAAPRCIEWVWLVWPRRGGLTGVRSLR